MTVFPDLSFLQPTYQAFGSALAVIFAVLLILAFTRWRPIIIFLVSLLVLAILFVTPGRWLTLYDFVNSAIGPLSSAFFVLCGFSLISLFSQRRAVAGRDEAVFVCFVALLGAILYCSALGILVFPVYSLGFEPSVWLILPAVVLVAGLVFRSYMTLIWVTFGMLVWLTDLAPGNNLWDAFIDPISWVASLCLATTHLLAKVGRQVPYYGLRMSSRP